VSPTTSLSRTRVGRRRPVLFLPTPSSHVFAGRPHPRLPTIFLRPPFPPWRFDPAAFSLHGSLTITTGRRSSSTTTTGRRRCTATIRPAEELFHDNQAFSPAALAAAPSGHFLSTGTIAAAVRGLPCRTPPPPHKFRAWTHCRAPSSLPFIFCYFSNLILAD
jgi:hypothetical protein